MRTIFAVANCISIPRILQGLQEFKGNKLDSAGFRRRRHALAGTGTPLHAGRRARLIRQGERFYPGWAR